MLVGTELAWAMIDRVCSTPVDGALPMTGMAVLAKEIGVAAGGANGIVAGAQFDATAEGSRMFVRTVLPRAGLD